MRWLRKMLCATDGPGVRNRRARWAVVAALLACGCGGAQAPTKNTATAGSTPSVASHQPTKPAAEAIQAAENTAQNTMTTVNSAPHLSGSETTTAVPLKITLTPSETPLKIGSTSNMAATIQNISYVPVTIYTSTLLLTTPAIVGGKASKCVVDIPQANLNSSLTPTVTLQPQDSVTALFNLSQPPRYARPVRSAYETTEQFEQAQSSYMSFMRSCQMGWGGPVERMLDFSPGNYDYYLQGSFTLCTDSSKREENPACSQPVRNFSASASFRVGIDQTSIVIFSVLGGWLALLYVIFSKASQPGSILHDFNAALINVAPEEKSKNPLGRFMQKMMTSEGMRAVCRFLIRLIATAILSAAFTVISSRISNPSLPISISVMDAWGAMTMGFLSYFIGAKFISSLTNWSAPTTVVGPAGNAAPARNAEAPNP